MNQHDADLAARAERDQKVLAANRLYNKLDAVKQSKFQDKFPAVVEHCMRLVFERLQSGLHKEAPTPLTNHEVAALTSAAAELYKIHSHLHD